MNNLPHGVLGRLLVGCQRDLARATTVGGLTSEAECLVLADGHDVLLDKLVDIITLLAGKVAAIGKKRVRVNMICTVGYW